MTINKLTALEQGNAANSNGGDVAASVNGLIDRTSNASKSATVSLFGSSSSYYQKDTARHNSTIASSSWAYAVANLGDAISITNYKGVGGNNTQQMLDRIQVDILDIKTDWVFMNAGVNDFYGYAFSAQTVFDNMVIICTQIIANGSKVLLLNCPVQSASRSNFTPEKSKASADYNRMIAEWGRNIDGFILVDTYSEAVNHADSVNGAAKYGYIGTDGIHKALYGSWRIGEAVVKALARYIRQDSNLKTISPLTSGDYGDVNFSNFNGTSGNSGTGGSGVVPDGWNLSRNSGEGAVVGAVVDGYYQLQISKSVIATASKFRINSDNMSSLLAGGENIKSKLVLDFDTGDLLLEELRVYMYVVNSGDFYTVDWGRSYNGFTPLPNMTAKNIQIDLLPEIILDTPTDFRIYIQAQLSGSGNATFTLKGLRIDNA